MIQVGILHQSGPMLGWLKRSVRETPAFSVAWSALTGDSALSRHRERHADIVLFDVSLPLTPCPELIAKLTRIHPASILLVAADPAASRKLLFEVIGSAAVDLVSAPPLNDSKGIDELRRKLVMLGRLLPSSPDPGLDRVSRRDGGELSSVAASARVPTNAASGGTTAIIGIGASTGGPQALAEVLGGLPADLSAAVVVVQHLDRAFLPRLQTWLQGECALPVLLAPEGHVLRKGTVVVADTDGHLLLRASGAHVLTHYQAPSAQHAHRPSIDVFFESMVKLRDAPRCGVLLTGMGRDGAAGLLALRRSGALTLAQDRESSIVYGMPRAALALGAIDEPVPLNEIATHLLHFVQATTGVGHPSYRNE